MVSFLSLERNEDFKHSILIRNTFDALYGKRIVRKKFSGRLARESTLVSAIHRRISRKSERHLLRRNQRSIYRKPVFAFYFQPCRIVKRRIRNIRKSHGVFKRVYGCRICLLTDRKADLGILQRRKMRVVRSLLVRFSLMEPCLFVCQTASKEMTKALSRQNQKNAFSIIRLRCLRQIASNFTSSMAAISCT